MKRSLIEILLGYVQKLVATKWPVKYHFTA
jgi:hypothetical protein